MFKRVIAGTWHVAWLAQIALRSLRQSGARLTLRKIRNHLVNTGFLRRPISLVDVAMKGSQSLSSYYPSEQIGRAPEVLEPSVVLISLLSIPQCRKYRVDQKLEQFTRLGIPCRVVEWTRTEEARSALQLASTAIFYRVPATEDVLFLVREAKRLGVEVYWEVDDLIFDLEAYRKNTHLAKLEPKLRDELLRGAELYHSALLEVGQGIASTPAIARYMERMTGRTAPIIPNGLDDQTLSIVERLPPRPAAVSDKVVIVYGSGTTTHDVDFVQATEGLLDVMAERPNVQLHLLGPLEIDARFEAFSDRIIRIPFSGFEPYLASLARCDIGIAPLEPTTFNDAKSNIKFIEYAMTGLPCVASPAAEFASVIQDGRNGFLAGTPSEWRERLLALVDDPEKRRSIAEAARHTVEEWYGTDQIAERHVRPLLKKARDDKTKRILLVNVLFHPRSFGGATIVAEQMARRLAAEESCEVFVFTTWPNGLAPDYSLLRYRADGINVVAARVPEVPDQPEAFDDPAVGEVFQAVLASIRPDIVHFHSIQTLGTRMLDACSAAAIPFIVTTHDAWWLCERQFLVDAAGRYCGQWEVDPQICSLCVRDSKYNAKRDRLAQLAYSSSRIVALRDALAKAALVLSPSKFSRDLFIANGVPPDRILINQNGVQLPGPNFKRRPHDKLRFAYVGGVRVPEKGYDLLMAAFETLNEDVELQVVDNTANLGFKSALPSSQALGRVTLRSVPAYTQDTLDAFFSNVDVLVFPSQAKESFGLTVREALARDVWVITTDAGGVTEAIVEGENGLVIPQSSDPSHLRQAVLKTITRFGLHGSFVNPYKADIHSFDDQANELRDVLLEIATTSSGRKPQELKRDDVAAPLLV